MDTKLAEILSNAIETQRQAMLDAADYIWKHPETGFKEWSATEYLSNKFRSLGYEIHAPKDIPGFYCDIDTGRSGPKVLIIGELDALTVPGHPACDKDTNAVHACGHHAQTSALLGIAGALKQPHVLDMLSGSIRLMAVPAEELIELEERQAMKKQGKIHYMGGKAEFMHRGYMDDCSIAILVHTMAHPKPLIYLIGGSNGCLLKSAKYIGRAAHAGTSPEDGINALNAAMAGLNAVNSQRETFRDTDHVRFHYIMTKGGSLVNTVPDDVRFESYVRASSTKSLIEVNKKINRALAASAAAFSANLEIDDQPGYLPLENDLTLSQIAADVVRSQFGEEHLMMDLSCIMGGCTDMGDMSAVMPSIQACITGASGQAHGPNFAITSPQTAIIDSARFQLLLAGSLLENGAANANLVVSHSKPIFKTKQEYFKAVDSLSNHFEAVSYPDSNTAVIKY
jgi:amidohydrolase